MGLFLLLQMFLVSAVVTLTANAQIAFNGPVALAINGSGPCNEVNISRPTELTVYPGLPTN
jgi:hypothetical protein